MKKSVYQFPSHEVEQALHVLNTAIKNHRLWADNLHTSILCHKQFSKDILDEAAHRHCEFGKWYYGEVSESIKSIKEFAELEPVHTYMHSHARDLALLAEQNKKIEVEDYQAFLTNQHHLIDLLTQLRDILIEHEHCFDAVTGAVNRRSISLLLEQSFENMQRYGHVYSMAMLDIDFFKKINDQYGHVIGDKVLKKICIYFRQTLRKTDCIGRYGGEEFLIIFPETHKQTAFDLMSKGGEGISKDPLIIEDLSINATVSIGVSEVSKDDVDAWMAVKRADSALYKAKSSGRDCVKQE